MEAHKDLLSCCKMFMVAVVGVALQLLLAAVQFNPN